MSPYLEVFVEEVSATVTLLFNFSLIPLYHAGAYLPNMTQLRLSNSLVPCVRDLGTSLSSLKILWMTRCKLKDLDGLPALQNLQEFYLAFNDVEDISVVTMLSSLEVLDLERSVSVMYRWGWGGGWNGDEVE